MELRDAVWQVRPYGVVVKVAAPSNSKLPQWQRQKLKGHWITFTHDGPREVARHFRSMADRVRDVASKVKVNLLGPNNSRDPLFARLKDLAELQMRPAVVYNYLVVRRAVQRNEHFGNAALADSSLEALPTLGELRGLFEQLWGELKEGVRFNADLAVEEHSARLAVDQAGVRSALGGDELQELAQGGAYEAGLVAAEVDDGDVALVEFGVHP